MVDTHTRVRIHALIDTLHTTHTDKMSRTQCEHIMKVGLKRLRYTYDISSFTKRVQEEVIPKLGDGAPTSDPEMLCLFAYHSIQRGRKYSAKEADEIIQRLTIEEKDGTRTVQFLGNGTVSGNFMQRLWFWGQGVWKLDGANPPSIDTWYKAFEERCKKLFRNEVTELFDHDDVYGFDLDGNIEDLRTSPGFPRNAIDSEYHQRAKPLLGLLQLLTAVYQDNVTYSPSVLRTWPKIRVLLEPYARRFNFEYILKCDEYDAVCRMELKEFLKKWVNLKEM